MTISSSTALTDAKKNISEHEFRKTGQVRKSLSELNLQDLMNAQARESFPDFDSRLVERFDLDKLKDSDNLKEDLVSNIIALEKLIAVLKEALVRATTPYANAQSCMKFVQNGFAEILNPNFALEKELAQLVEAKKPPNGEFYKTRANKNEYAVAFFHRVYGDFYEAKVLRYKSQIQAMDADFAHLLGQYTDSIRLLTKREENDETLAKVGSFGEVMRLGSVAARRKSAAA